MKALNDRVICRLCNMPDKTKGGILLPKQAFQDGEAKINMGRVISAGDGMVLRNGEIIPVKVKEGDVIVWEQFGALRMEILLSCRGRGYLFFHLFYFASCYFLYGSWHNFYHCNCLA